MDILNKIVICLAFASCLSCSESGSGSDDEFAESPDEAFRIDISTIDVVYDFEPTENTFEGSATIQFVLREGQSRALFHFDPVVADRVQDAIHTLILDGETLDATNEDDLRVIRFSGSSQDAYEIVRELDPEDEHVLQLSWTANNTFEGIGYPEHAGWFWTQVDDTEGLGNQVLWPTINAPGEQAHHTIEVRIQSPDDYIMLGSGVISNETQAGVQVWRLDTEREVSSYTVMLAAMPEDDVTVREFNAGTTPVTIVSTGSGAELDNAQSLTVAELSQLETDFGSFPAPSMQILLVDWEDGMEYFGATTTGLSSLSHELAHMYWGTSAVGKTWADTWLDEALAVWWDENDDAAIEPVADSFRSDIVSGWHAITPGFDGRAYDEGSQIIAAIAERVGGDQVMIDILKEIYQRRAFEPFTTEAFIDDFVLATGDEQIRTSLNQWLLD